MRVDESEGCKGKEKRSDELRVETKLQQQQLIPVGRGIFFVQISCVEPRVGRRTGRRWVSSLCRQTGYVRKLQLFRCLDGLMFHTLRASGIFFFFPACRDSAGEHPYSNTDCTVRGIELGPTADQTSPITTLAVLASASHLHIFSCFCVR